MSARSVHLQMMMMSRRRFFLGHFAASAQEDAGLPRLCRAKSREKVRLGAADMPVTGIMAGQGLVCCCRSTVASVMPVVVGLVGQMWTDVGMALVRAVGAVSV